MQFSQVSFLLPQEDILSSNAFVPDLQNRINLQNNKKTKISNEYLAYRMPLMKSCLKPLKFLVYHASLNENKTFLRKRYSVILHFYFLLAL